VVPRINLVLVSGLTWLALTTPALHAMTLADGGRAISRIVVAADPIPAERTAARELARYLERASGASFVTEDETEVPVRGPAILVGATREARSSANPPGSLEPEAWVIRRHGEKLLLYGGRPRGTLYAVYRFLEDHVGVRWWTPYEESVPHRATLRVGVTDRSGSPGFAYRGISGIQGPSPFSARNRHSGHRARLAWQWGGMQGFGPPFPVHTFYLYIPLEEYFDEHPEFFSEIAGLRFAGPGQLCLTNTELLDEVARRMRGFIEQARAEAELSGEPPPQLFAFSQNDWKNPCECERCAELAVRENSESGPVIRFVNRLADEIADDYPEVSIVTLAYQYTFLPPRTLSARDNVIVYFSALHHRDFSKALQHPDNRESLNALRGWRARAPRLRVWDYSVLFGDYGEFPLPNLRVLYDDFGLYLDLGVEGVFLQHEFPIAADMRDLKLWMILKLMEDPRADYRKLLHEFTDGFYGAAAKTIRRYLRLLERSAAKHSARIGFGVEPDDYAYLDGEFTVRAQALFDRAEGKVVGDAVLGRRVRHARLTLDRATLVRWNTLKAGLGVAAGRDDRSSLDWDAVARRYRRTWYEQIRLRMPAASRGAAQAEVNREIEYWSARAERPPG
jgi:hypothetical protein